MDLGIKYVHTNIVARDWRKLADFYIQVFGCKQVPPERDLYGDWIDKATGIENVSLRGVHLSLPGYEKGPTLEIFEYEPKCDREEDHNKINYEGFGHIAFHVEDVEKVLSKILAHGGGQLGEVVTKEYNGLGLLTFVYAKDPEGNFIEIQNWSKE